VFWDKIIIVLSYKKSQKLENKTKEKK